MALKKIGLYSSIRIQAVARPSNHTVWVCRGPLDDRITFMPKCDKISYNNNFHHVEDRSVELFLWLRVQMLPELEMPVPTHPTIQTASGAGKMGV